MSEPTQENYEQWLLEKYGVKSRFELPRPVLNKLEEYEYHLSSAGFYFDDLIEYVKEDTEGKG